MNDAPSSPPAAPAPTASQRKSQELRKKIIEQYGILRPKFALTLGGLRKLSVDPEDKRVQRMLLARGPRHSTRNQRFIHACLAHLPVDLYLDIGVNYGECLVAQPFHCGVRTRGYEANPRLIPFIQRTLGFNDDLERIEISNKAMSVEAGGVIDFYIDNAWSGTSSVIPRASGRSSTQCRVGTTTIDTEVAREHEVNLLLIKIDVEGHEPQVFRGGVQTYARVPNIVCMMEFDSTFIAKGGEDPVAFYRELAQHFTVLCSRGGTWGPAADYAALQAANEARTLGPGETHLDVVLTRFADPELARSFDSKVLPSLAKPGARG